MSDTVEPPARPLTHIGEKPMTIDGARELLRLNPPGQGVMYMHIAGMYAAPFYIEWLLDRIAEMAKPKRKRRK